ncbi:hypothetical protein BaRGS_00031133 [Batillaria attramentaria]|uniref:Uncharacterized protein n=1 Tax=Batillaria attramentaria TaxID=370345 RepID=A0ABD0JSP5_9CAEN
MLSRSVLKHYPDFYWHIVGCENVFECNAARRSVTLKLSSVSNCPPRQSCYLSRNRASLILLLPARKRATSNWTQPLAVILLAAVTTAIDD